MPRCGGVQVPKQGPRQEAQRDPSEAQAEEKEQLGRAARRGDRGCGGHGDQQPAAHVQGAPHLRRQPPERGPAAHRRVAPRVLRPGHAGGRAHERRGLVRVGRVDFGGEAVCIRGGALYRRGRQRDAARRHHPLRDAAAHQPPARLRAARRALGPRHDARRAWRHPRGRHQPHAAHAAHQEVAAPPRRQPADPGAALAQPAPHVRRGRHAADVPHRQGPAPPRRPATPLPRAARGPAVLRAARRLRG